MARATAGFEAEEVDKPKKPSKLPFDPGKSAFDNVFDKLMDKYYTPSSGGANAKASIQLGGAVAFSFIDHNVWYRF